LIDRLGDRAPRRVVGILDGQGSADLFRAPSLRQQLLHPLTENVVTVDASCATADTSLGSRPMRSRRAVATGRVDIAAQLATDRRRTTSQLNRDRPHRRTERRRSEIAMRSSSDKNLAEIGALPLVITGGKCSVLPPLAGMSRP
jgi:hypothetical protein